MRATVPQEKARNRYETSLRAREFEIELFWKRALFFWGFVAATFAGYVAAEERTALGIVLACFGWVCSLAWTLGNRGSKYWYENWERKVVCIEDEITGPLFSAPEPRVPKGVWLSARQYSVSKLAIGLSDYVFLVWTAILVKGASNVLGLNSISPQVARWSLLAFIAGSFVYGVLLAFNARSGSRRTSTL